MSGLCVSTHKFIKETKPRANETIYKDSSRALLLLCFPVEQTKLARLCESAMGIQIFFLFEK